MRLLVLYSILPDRTLNVWGRKMVTYPGWETLLSASAVRPLTSSHVDEKNVSFPLSKVHGNM